MAYDPKALPQGLKQWYRRIGKKGGAARQQQMTPEERRELAKKAARERWTKHRTEGLWVWRRTQHRYCSKRRCANGRIAAVPIRDIACQLSTLLEALHAVPK